MILICYEIGFNTLLKVNMLNKSRFTVKDMHVKRYTDKYIIYIVTDGELDIMNNNEVLKLLPGDVYIFDKNEYQTPHKNTDVEFYYIHFETDDFFKRDISDAEYCEEIKRRKSEFFKTNIYGTECYDSIRALLHQRMHIQNKSLLRHIKNILDENTISYECNSPERRFEISSCVMKLLMRLERNDYENISGEYKGKNGYVSDTVSKIIDYIGRNFNKKISGTDIEKEFLINFDYANRIFKKEIGYSIFKYRNILRINTAKVKLETTNLDIEAIAEEVGFSDKYYFCKCFGNYAGMTPTEYRNTFFCR